MYYILKSTQEFVRVNISHYTGIVFIVSLDKRLKFKIYDIEQAMSMIRPLNELERLLLYGYKIK